MSAICGGVISESMHKENVEKFGIDADSMAFVMPDKWYKRYILLKKSGMNKEAKQIFDRYAVSQI